MVCSSSSLSFFFHNNMPKPSFSVHILRVNLVQSVHTHYSSAQCDNMQVRDDRADLPLVLSHVVVKTVDRVRTCSKTEEVFGLSVMLTASGCPASQKESFSLDQMIIIEKRL